MTVTTEASQCHTEDDSNFCSNCCPLLVIAVINNRDYCFNCCRRLPFHPFPPFLITACLPVISNTLSLSRSLSTSIASLSPFCTTYHCHTKYGLMFFHTKKTIILSFFSTTDRFSYCNTSQFYVRTARFHISLVICHQ